MGDGIRGKMVKLGPEVIHDALEERMRGQRKTSVDMAEEQDALPLPGRKAERWAMAFGGKW